MLTEPHVQQPAAISTTQHSMLNAPEAQTAVTPQASTTALMSFDTKEKSSAQVELTCDLAGAYPFTVDTYRPPVPVMVAFGADRLHRCRLNGAWDLERAVADHAHALFRSIHKCPNKHTANNVQQWDDLTFQFGPRTILCANKEMIFGYASSHVEAENLVQWFSKKYSKPSGPSGGVFYLIEYSRNCIDCHEVLLPSDTMLSPEALCLHYGNGSQDWHQSYIEKLSNRPNGLSIFEGSPGTGKTCYLRHLMGVLKESHRFYFIPPSTMEILSRPDFIGFWTYQQRAYSDQQFVVVLEDSEAALMTRGADNREQVSAILNISDGLLADFLRLQVICTINCAAAEIDQALLRPGRLLCHRVFGRLDYLQATRLAKSLGKTLPEVRDYSLAEVFAGHGQGEINHVRIGFDA